MEKIVTKDYKDLLNDYLNRQIEPEPEPSDKFVEV